MFEALFGKGVQPQVETEPTEETRRQEQFDATHEEDIRNARMSLLQSELTGVASFPERFEDALKDAVVDGNFSPVYELLQYMKHKAETLEKDYNESWKDLGHDAYFPEKKS